MTQENTTTHRPPQLDVAYDAEVRRFTGIPTTDPEAALEFCRSLAQFLAADTRQSQLDQARGDGADAAPQPPRVAQPEISAVLPVHDEEENLPELYPRLTAVLEGTGLPYEIVFVDDGSRDGSLEYLHRIAAQDRRVVVVELARNFGHQAAITAGLDHARGNGVVVMDADLQDPPEVLPQFIAKWQEGHDVVFAIREGRKEGPLKRAAYMTFYRLLRRVANIQIPINAGDFCIMDRRVVDLLAEMPERNRFIRGIRSWVGLNQVGLAYERHARHAGQPKYTFRRLVYLALDGLVSFSYIPLRLITMLGFGVSLFSIMMAIFYLAKKLLVGLSPPGFATLIVSIFFLAGIQLITMGVMGEYVGRIFEEVKRRPLYVVRRVTRG
ncbi:MAG TPA: glycosyltransferase family 2 protein [Herpetosiphonaceae bacterium]|nr:glycosyltransferase family 2 protein [Herpetosiphonaceae bacterium]